MGKGRAHFEVLKFEYSKKSKKHLKLDKFLLAEKKGLRRNGGRTGRNLWGK